MSQPVSSRLILCIIGVSLPILGGPLCSSSDEGGDQLTAVASSTEVPVESVGPQFGGVTQPLGPYIAELRPQDKQLEVQVRDRWGQPVPMKGASLTARLGGSDEPVQIVLRPRGQKFVGEIVTADGPGPVVLAYSPPGDPTVLDSSFPSVPLPMVKADISPRHHGQVSYVGDHRVEFTVTPEGEVMASVTDSNGVPVPPSEVDFEQVRLVTPSGPRVVELQPRGAARRRGENAPRPSHGPARRAHRPARAAARAGATSPTRCARPRLGAPSPSPALARSRASTPRPRGVPAAPRSAR